MSAFIDTMFWPLAACVVLTGIHAYLGLHVLARQVIFVDLALAQIAALGAGTAILFTHTPDCPEAYWLSLAFTLAGAAVLSMTRHKKQSVPQEAIIGIVYAVSAALLVMVLSRSGEGDEHIRQMLIGNILLVRTSDVMKMAALYACVGLVHWVFRRQFFRISEAPERAFAERMNVRLWDFLFYALFGIVVTSSVRIAGVLLVFAFLVVPAVCATLVAATTRARLWIGWGVGLAASALGMAVSYYMDFPTGASVVAVFGAVLGVIGIVKVIK